MVWGCWDESPWKENLPASIQILMQATLGSKDGDKVSKEEEPNLAPDTRNPLPIREKHTIEELISLSRRGRHSRTGSGF